MSYPGGRSRESYLLYLEDGRRVIGTRRNKIERARREVHILGSLTRKNCNSPQLLAYNHAQILFQQALDGMRLSEALAIADDNDDHERMEALLVSSLTSLSSIHEAASASGLDHELKILGHGRVWREKLLDRPNVLGKYLRVPAPSLDVAPMKEIIAVRRPRFIKWDARPGNALVDVNGSVQWFDWEHAGCRNRLDDLVWLLADEFVPDKSAIEQKVLEHLLPSFADDLSEADALQYLAIYGCCHLTVRLGLILNHLDNAWWDRDYCIAQDKIGVTLDCTLRTCQRGARWATWSDYTRPLEEWFRSIQKPILQLVDSNS